MNATEYDSMATYGGVDVGHGHFFACAIDTDNMMVMFPDYALQLEGVVEWLGHQQCEGICIDGPPQPNQGRLRDVLPANAVASRERRVAEFRLGIGGCYATPGQPPPANAFNAWMSSSFDLFNALQQQFNWQIDLGGGQGQLIETHPTYAFKALLGTDPIVVDGLEKPRTDPRRQLRPKRQADGRQGRVDLLRQAFQNLGLPVTEDVAHKWQSGIDWIDATICALLALWKSHNRIRVRAIGDAQEGSIYLFVPENPWELPGAFDANPANQARVRGVVQGANAVILRLGENGPGGLSQTETIETTLHAFDDDTCWLPIGSRANFNLCQNLRQVGGRLYLAFGQVLRLHVVIGDCLYSDQPLAFPGEANPWPVCEAFGWVEVLDVREVNIENFEVRHNGAWAPGFTDGQACLLWARVAAD